MYNSRVTTSDLQKIKDILSQNGVEFAGIFGSRARGEEKPESDVDILIRFNNDDKSLLDLIHIQNTISDILGIKVDLVTEEALHPLMKEGIYRDLKVIYGER